MKPTKALSLLHYRLIHRRRVAAIAKALDSWIPWGARVVDVGAGDGLLAKALLQRRSDITIVAVEVLHRSRGVVPTAVYDGAHLPFADRAFHVVLLIDVLHHTDAAATLLAEAARVAEQFILVKDHVASTALDWHTLRLMDWAGNARHGIALPYTYLSTDQWRTLFRDVALECVDVRSFLGLYAWPVSLLFERSLHIMVKLRHGPFRGDHDSAGPFD